jgi:hypothetical protein
MKRYSLVIHLNIHEEDDKKANKMANKYIKKLHKMDDNKAMIVSLVENEFGSMDYKDVLPR